MSKRFVLLSSTIITLFLLVLIMTINGSAKSGTVSVASKEASGIGSLNLQTIVSQLKTQARKKANIDIGLFSAAILTKNKLEAVEVLQNEIVNKSNNSNIQTLMFDIMQCVLTSAKPNEISAEQKSKAYAQLKQMLDNKRVCTNVKSRILYECKMTTQDLPKLEKHLAASNKTLAFHCLRRIYELSCGIGIQKAKEILNKSPNSSGKLSVSARYIISDSIRDGLLTEDKSTWVEKCASWFDKARNATVRKTWLYALSNMRCESALISIVENEEIDQSSKQYAIFENEHVVSDISRRKTDESNAFTQKCMRIIESDEAMKALRKGMSTKTLGTMNLK